MTFGKISSRNKWQYIVPLLGIVSLLIASVIVSSKKYFWNDELLSLYPVSDPSFSHMLVASGDRFNVAPPLYFVLGWLWTQLFTSSDLSLRLLSSLTICASFILVWITLRRTYNFWSASIGTLSVFSLSELILYHNAEVRMYGLFAAVCALGLLQFDIINSRQKSSWRLLGANILIHGAIVLTHVYGTLFSGAILFAFVLRDRFSKVFRIDVYLSVVLGWLFLVPFISSILNQANNSAKWWWVMSTSEFLNIIVFSSKLPFLILVLLLISGFMNINQFINQDEVKTHRDIRDPITEISLLIVAGGFMAVPFFAWIISMTIKPMLLDRYIIPTIAISWPIFMAYLSSCIFPNAISSGESTERSSLTNLLLAHSGKLAQVLLIIVLLIYPIYTAYRMGYSPPPGAADDSYGYTDLPIAMEAGHDFLPRVHYSSEPNRYFHILDWDIAIKNTKSAFATGDYTHLQALKRNYPFINTIQSQEFLAKFDRFLVLNEKDQKWFEWRVENDPKYRVKSLGTVEDGAYGPLEVFLVEKK
jgi:hypothetical protein